MGNGLMTFANVTVGNINDGIDEYYDEVDTDVQKAEKDAEDFILNNVKRGEASIASNEAYYTTLVRQKKENFNQIFSEYGEDKLEELNVLSEARPDLFSGDLATARNNVRMFIEDASAPDISPEGVISMPMFSDKTGKTTFTPIAGEGANLYTNSVFAQENITGADYFSRQKEEVMKNVYNAYGDNFGQHSKSIHLTNYVPPGSPAKKIVEERRDFNTGFEIQPTDITDNITEILNREILTDPNAMTRGQILSATNWYPIQNYDDMYAAAYTDNRGDALGTASDVLNASITMLNAIEERDGPGSAQSAVDSGKFTSNSVMSVLMNNPAIEMSRIALLEAAKLDTSLASELYQGEINSNIPSDDRDDNQNAAIIRMKQIQKSYYDNAELVVRESGFYTRKNQFINLATPNEFPEHLNINIRGTKMIVIPNPVAGLVKLVPRSNASDNSAAITMSVRSFTPENKGGFKKDGSEGLNLYYNTDYGYNAKTDQNERMNMIQQDFLRNDPFGLEFVDTLRANISNTNN